MTVSGADQSAAEAVARQVVWLLLVAAGAALLSWRLRLAPVLVCAAGAVAATWSGRIVLPSPGTELVLLALLPPLVFDAAFRFDRSANGGGVLWPVSRGLLRALATMAVVASIATLVIDVPPASGLLVGSALAASDPGALSLLRRASIPRGSVGVVATENLASSATAIVGFVALLHLTGEGSSVLAGGQWPLGLAGAALIGGLLARACSVLVSRTAHAPSALALSSGLAYGSYAIAEAVEVPGAIACLVAGLAHERYTVGSVRAVRRRLRHLWSYLGFLATALAFGAAGTAIPLLQLLERAWPIVVIAGAVLAVRAALGWARSASLRAERRSLAWTGLGGGLATALVLGLPDATVAREAVASLGLGVVLLTLAAQGLTLPWVLRRGGSGGGGGPASTAHGMAAG